MNPQSSADAKPTGVQGSPDAPAFKPRPIAFAISLCLYAAWMAILIHWAIRLRQANPL